MYIRNILIYMDGIYKNKILCLMYQCRDTSNCKQFTKCILFYDY